MMKKIFFGVTILMLLWVSGCSLAENSFEHTRKESSFPVLPEQISEIKTLYCDEVLKRTNSTAEFFPNNELEVSDMIEESNSQDFFSEQDIIFLEKYGYSIVSEKGLVERDEVTYYYPIIFQDTEELVVIYNYQGKFQKRTLNPEHPNHIYEPLDYEFIHFTVSSYEAIEEIETNEEYTLLYNKTHGELQKWRFGQLENSYSLSKGTTYEGKSELEGYIFQSDTSAYALTYEGNFKQVATEIKKVVSCNFRVSEEYYSQPVFLMPNGHQNALIDSTLKRI